MSHRTNLCFVVLPLVALVLLGLRPDFALKGEEPLFLRTPSGMAFQYPRGRSTPLLAEDVAFYGDAALNQFFSGDHPMDKAANEAMILYKKMRPSFLGACFGKWVAVGPDGVTVIAHSEDQVRSIADDRYGPPDADYYCNCIGCEVLEYAYMDSSSTQLLAIDDPNANSAVVDGKILVRAEHSWGGQDFQDVVFAHDPGASHIGVPLDVLSNPPQNIRPQRSHDIWSVGPYGSTTKVRSYKGHTIRIANTQIMTDVIQARTWLLGRPVLSEFVNTINYKAKEPLELKKLQTAPEAST